MCGVAGLENKNRKRTLHGLLRGYHLTGRRWEFGTCSLPSGMSGSFNFFANFWFRLRRLHHAASGLYSFRWLSHSRGSISHYKLHSIPYIGLLNRVALFSISPSFYETYQLSRLDSWHFCGPRRRELNWRSWAGWWRPSFTLGGFCIIVVAIKTRGWTFPFNVW